MVEIGAPLEEDGTGRIVLEHLIYRRTEMVVQRSALPDAYVFAFLLVPFIHLRL